MSAFHQRHAAPLLILLSLLLAGCGAPSAEDEKAPEPEVSVKVAPLETRTFEDRIEANGNWRGQGELVLAAPFAGFIDALNVHAGDQVRAGQSVGTLTTLESHAALQGALLMERDARDAVARAEAQRAVALAQRDRVRVPLVASQAGIVVRRSAEPGAQVAEAAEVLAIVPWTGLVFEAHLPQAQRARIRPGQKAQIREEGQPLRAAIVQRLLPTADAADQSALVWLTPVTRLPAPQLDHFGAASIAVGATHSAIAVPDTSIVEDDLTGEKRVAVVDAAKRAHWTPVILGVGAGGWHELRSPSLAAGTRVVVEGQRGLPDSARVQWAP
jgi:multidrug efflux pump subunit AcrA (membrane-fusion protein)